MMMEPVVTTTILVVAVSFFWYKWWKSFRSRLENKIPFEGIPMAPNSHWLTGHLSIMSRDFRKRLYAICVVHASEDGLCSFWWGNAPYISVNRHQDARAVLHASAVRQQSRFVYKHMRMFLGYKNIGVLMGREWKFHRSAILRAFGPTPVVQSRAAILDVTRTFCKSVRRRAQDKDAVEMDVEPLMKMITVDIFGQTALSTDLKSCELLRPNPIAEAFDFLSSELTRRIQDPTGLSSNLYSLPTLANRRHLEARTILRSFVARIIHDRRKQLASTKPNVDTQKDLLSHLLEAHQELVEEEQSQPEHVSDQTLSDIMLSLLFAGYDTTSITLTYALYCVSQDKDIESCCLEEISRVFRDNVSDPDGLVLCRAVILETLRLYPPAVANTRHVTSPIKLSSGYTVPEGANIFIPIYFIQRDEKNFPRPNEFVPERWVKKNNDGTWIERTDGDNDDSTLIAAANPKAFFAFSAGARSCPGKSFAIHEAVLVLASLLRELKFETLPGYEVTPIKIGLVQRPDGGIPMTIRPRRRVEEN